MKDAGVFTKFSRRIDKVVEYAENDDGINFMKSTKETMNQINSFLSKEEINKILLCFYKKDL